MNNIDKLRLIILNRIDDIYDKKGNDIDLYDTSFGKKILESLPAGTEHVVVEPEDTKKNCAICGGPVEDGVSMYCKECNKKIMRDRYNAMRSI